MKFSERWLRQWVKITADTQTLVDKLTLAGLEVDSVTPVAPPFTGVIVAAITACTPHPRADKLRIVQVDTGKETVPVVCGAANARVGLKAPFARIGATLPGGVTIEKAKLRGVDSLGMLCARDELGLADGADQAAEGLLALPADAPLGQCLRTYLQLDDHSIAIDLTPNRGDCLSIQGLAREVGAHFLADVTPEPIAPMPAVTDHCFPVQIAETVQSACPRYVGRVISNIDNQQTTPLWLQERLRRSGIRTIDPVVDVTNYVMLELGQPLHGFDVAALSGAITVRHANTEISNGGAATQETLVLLDGQTVTLTDDTLLIADERQPLAIAGVMGGQAAKVSCTTRQLFLESAFFDPIALAGKARHYGLQTESAHRFERGIDCQLPRQAIERATALIVGICGGEPGPVTEVVSEAHLPKQRTITLHADKVTALLGVTLPDAHIAALLTCLGLVVTAEGPRMWQVQVPSWRTDLMLAEDLVEEVGRLYGYNRLPTTVLTTPMKPPPVDPARVPMTDLRRVLVSSGYQEAITFSFIDPQWHAVFNPAHKALTLANPMARNLSVMRRSLLPGLVNRVHYNVNRQQQRVRLFETGLIFINDQALAQDTVPQQENRLAAVITGSRLPEGWATADTPVDFYDMKGDLQAVLALGGNAAYRFVPAQHAAMHPGQCAGIYRGDQLIGHVGVIHPAVAAKLAVPTALSLMEVNVDAICQRQAAPIEPLSKYPEIRRDLALVVSQQVTAEQLCQVIQDEGGDWLCTVCPFDQYVGQGIESGYKSLALSLTWQHPSRTLQDAEINRWIERIVARLTRDMGAHLRQT